MEIITNDEYWVLRRKSMLRENAYDYLTYIGKVCDAPCPTTVGTFYSRGEAKEHAIFLKHISGVTGDIEPVFVKEQYKITKR